MKTIAIIGGGVAGLALANAMLKYSNEWKVTVFEQAKQIRTKLGAGIGLQAGQIVLNELGFKEKLQELTVPISNIVVCKPSEEQVINVDLVAQQKKHVIPEGIDVMFRAILRTNLLNMLKDGLPEDVIQLDKKFQQYEVGNDNKVTTYFTDGTSFISDVLVGADGIHSGVQEQMTGHVENNYSGYGAWYGVALLGADSELMKAETKAMQFLVGDKTLVASYPCSKEGHVSFVLTHKMPEPIFEKMELEDAKTKAKEFAQGHEYPKFATLVDNAIRLMKLPLYSKGKIDKWQDGPVVLMGDLSCNVTIWWSRRKSSNHRCRRIG
jgi:2-polyprenyl-6-methoxyphenol hydroxylase-like FAD-dependent oxidoreductase